MGKQEDKFWENVEKLVKLLEAEPTLMTKQLMARGYSKKQILEARRQTKIKSPSHVWSRL